MSSKIGLNRGDPDWPRRSARIAGLSASAFALLIVGLVATNEDAPAPQALPVVALLLVTVLGAAIGWRRGRTGGIILIANAAALGLAASYSFWVSGLGWAGLFPAWLCYAGLPFAAGALFLLSEKSA